MKQSEVQVTLDFAVQDKIIVQHLHKVYHLHLYEQ